MPSVQTVSPTTHALTIAEVRDHVRESSTANDSYLRSLIKSATLNVEEFARRALINQTRRMDLPCFRDVITMDYGSLVSASLVTYKASGSTTLSTLSTAEYNVDTTSVPGRILRDLDGTWPSTRDMTHDAVQITYTVGFGSSQSDVPENYRQAMLLLIERWYDDRSDYVTGTIVAKLPHGVDALIRPTRNYRFV